MKSALKKQKVSSLSLARAAAQLSSKLEFDMQPFLQDKILSECIEFVGIALHKFESIIKSPSKIDATTLSTELVKTDKNLEKVKTKLNSIQENLTKIEKCLDEKLTKKWEMLKLTDPKDSSDKENREKVEAHMKTIKQMLATAKKKFAELQEPAEKALKKMAEIKPKLYALGISDNLDRCQKKVEKLNEELLFLCEATANMVCTSEIAQLISTTVQEAPKIFIPKLRSELAKSNKLLEEAGVQLSKFTAATTTTTTGKSETTAQNEPKQEHKVSNTA